jgi:CMP/dCMP kinase
MTESISHPFFTLAIDGGAATGKSSTARALAERLHFLHVDTGSHYRALTLLLIHHNILPTDESAIAKLLAQSPLSTSVESATSDAKIVVYGAVPADADLRSDAVNANVSKYAAVPAVRAALKDYQRSQREVAKSHDFSGLVMEGRDIGSVIFPDADLKIFLEADEATRAARRAKEGQSDSIAARDKIDSTRKTAPLVCPEDAVRIDNSHMTLAEVVAKIENLVKTRT